MLKPQNQTIKLLVCTGTQDIWAQDSWSQSGGYGNTGLFKTIVPKNYECQNYTLPKCCAHHFLTNCPVPKCLVTTCCGSVWIQGTLPVVSTLAVPFNNRREQRKPGHVIVFSQNRVVKEATMNACSGRGQLHPTRR